MPLPSAFHRSMLAALTLIGAAGSALASDVVTIHKPHRTVRPVATEPVPVGEPVDIPLGATGVVIRTPFFDVVTPGAPERIVRLPHYQHPDGSWDGLYGLSSSIQGYPCGQDCTDRSLLNYGYLPID